MQKNRFFARGVSTSIGLIVIVASTLILFGGVFIFQYLATQELQSLKIINSIQPATDGNNQQLIGGDTDRHGCLIAAGYSWCEAKQKCLRTWEEPCETDQIAGWKTYEDAVRGFLFKYPSSWTYQKFSCNLDGVAFCPLAGNNPSNCGQTCSIDSPSSPIYLYPFSSTSTAQNIKYWTEPNVSLNLNDSKYREIYTNMVNSYQFIGKKIYPKPTATLNFSPSIISKGGSSTLSWSSTNADNCYASGAPDVSFNWFGNQSTNGGTQTYNNIQSSLTFQLECENAEGTQSAMAEAALLVQ